MTAAGWRTLERATAKVTIGEDRSVLLELRTEALYGVGTLAWHLDDLVGARSLVEESVVVFRKVGDTSGLVFPLPRGIGARSG